MKKEEIISYDAVFHIIKSLLKLKEGLEKSFCLISLCKLVSSVLESSCIVCFVCVGKFLKGY